MSPSRYRITIRGTAYEVEVGDLSASPVTVTVDGVDYEVELPGAPERTSVTPRVRPAAAPRAAPTGSPAPRPAVSNQAGGGVVRAMMPGRVVSVNVNQGDRVESGQSVLVIESMKMEQTIAAPQAGTVRAVHVQAGDAVQHGQTLVELE